MRRFAFVGSVFAALGLCLAAPAAAVASFAGVRPAVAHGVAADVRPAVLAQPTLPIPTTCLPLPIPCPTGSSSTPPSGSPTPSNSPTPPTPGGTQVKCPKVTKTSATLCFVPGVDRTSWYWVDQQYQTLEIGPVNVPVKLPSPQDATTLPQELRQGNLYKISALQFDLLRHQVPTDAKITKFILTIEEGNSPRDQPEYNTENKVISACPATDIWALGEAELWKERPKYAPKKCVKGVHKAGATPADADRWIFNLTNMAKTWASDPFNNQGVVFIPVKKGDGPQNENFQINFRIPQRDTQNTPVNEYNDSKGRTVVSLTFKEVASPTTTSSSSTEPSESETSSSVPSTEPSTATSSSSSPPFTDTSSPPFTSTGGDTGTGGGFTSGPGGGFSSTAPGGTSVTGGTSIPTPGTTGGTTTVPTTGSSVPTQPIGQAAGPPIPTVKMPWFVWVMIPLAILALAAVRSILFEQAHGGIRPDGVIAAIRNRNAAARGASAGGGGSFLARARAIAKEGLSRKPGTKTGEG